MYQTSTSKGQELVAERMVREFNRLGHDAFLITSTYEDWETVATNEEVEKRGGYIHTYEEKLGIPVIRVASEMATWPPRRILFRDFVGVLTRIVADLKLNVLITHSTLWNGPEDATKFVAWNRQLSDQGAPKSPVLLCQMSHFQEASEERYTVEERTFRETWNKVSLGEILRQADYVLATTPTEKEQMKELGASEEKCILLPGGIDEDIFHGQELAFDFRGKYGIPKRTKLVSFVGTLEERKNVLAIVEVAKKFLGDQNAHFAIAGRIEGEYGERVKAAAAGLSNISILGQITDAEKGKLIEESYLNISLSKSEALGIAQLEFMYLGVPVITSGVGGQSWIVKNDVNGVVLNGPDDLKGACDAVTFLVANPKVRKKFSIEAVKTAAECTLSNLIQKLSKRLVVRLSASKFVSPIQEATEKVIEARVHGRRKVAVTTRRLIISSAGTGKSIISVPFEEISWIKRLVSRPWSIPIIGFALSAALFAIELFESSFFDNLTGRFNIIPVLSNPFANAVIAGVVPLVPLIISLIVFLKLAKNGFVVSYGKDSSVFLSSEFEKLLKIADSLTEKNLFWEKAASSS